MNTSEKYNVYLIPDEMQEHFNNNKNNQCFNHTERSGEYSQAVSKMLCDIFDKYDQLKALNYDQESEYYIKSILHNLNSFIENNKKETK